MVKSSSYYFVVNKECTFDDFFEIFTGVFEGIIETKYKLELLSVEAHEFAELEKTYRKANAEQRKNSHDKNFGKKKKEKMGLHHRQICKKWKGNLQVLRD